MNASIFSSLLNLISQDKVYKLTFCDITFHNGYQVFMNRQKYLED